MSILQQWMQRADDPILYTPDQEPQSHGGGEIVTLSGNDEATGMALLAWGGGHGHDWYPFASWPAGIQAGLKQALPGRPWHGAQLRARGIFVDHGQCGRSWQVILLVLLPGRRENR